MGRSELLVIIEKLASANQQLADEVRRLANIVAEQENMLECIAQSGAIEAP